MPKATLGVVVEVIIIDAKARDWCCCSNVQAQVRHAKRQAYLKLGNTTGRYGGVKVGHSS